jgi:hypothetical protein
MNQELTKQTAKQLMLLKGEARGAHFQNDAEFVLKEKGEQGLRKVEQELKKIGYPIKYNEINPFAFYPIGLRALSLLVIKKTFNWPNKKIEELGSYAMKVSWIIRLFMKYFFSIEKVLEEAQQTWSKYFNVGQLEIKEFNQKEKKIILKIKDFNLHPVYCHCLKGVFAEIGRMAIKPKTIACQETECSFDKGEENAHYFLIKWT